MEAICQVRSLGGRSIVVVRQADENLAASKNFKIQHIYIYIYIYIIYVYI